MVRLAVCEREVEIGREEKEWLRERLRKTGGRDRLVRRERKGQIKN